MTSEADSTLRRRPPTIELKATEVEADKAPSADEARGGSAAEGDAAPGNTSGGRARRGGGGMSPWIGLAVGVAVGVIATLVVVAGLWIADLGSTHGGLPPVNLAEPLAADVRQLASRLEKIEATLAAQRPDPTQATRIAAAEGEAKALESSLAALTRRLDEIVVTARTALAHADAAAAAADAAKAAAQSSVQRGDLDALASRIAAQAAAQRGDLETLTGRVAALATAQRNDVEALSGRIAALENAVKGLADTVARRPANADDRIARIFLAVEELRAAVERGAPYAAELAAVKSLGVIAANALAPLEPFAAEGVPSAAALGRELAALAPDLLQASGAPTTDNSFLGRLQANAEKLVRVTPVDAPRGDEPAAIIARIKIEAGRGDIAAALADIGRLPEAARAIAAPWVKKAAARDAALAAGRRLTLEALGAFGKPAAQ